MVFEVESIPSIVIDHEVLPFLNDGFQDSHLPLPRGEFATGPMIHIMDFEMENHVEFASVIPDGIQNLLRVFDAGHLSHRESVILFKDLSDFEQKLVESGTTGKEFSARLKLNIWASNLSVGKSWDFANEVDHVASETIYPFVQPKSNNVMNGGTNLGIFPVQIRLLGSEEM